jgi:hypothetical protein
MKRFGLADRLIVVLSDKYLRSPCCVSELLETSTDQRARTRTTTRTIGEASNFGGHDIYPLSG